jgi:hypothetical protein
MFFWIFFKVSKRISSFQVLVVTGDSQLADWFIWELTDKRIDSSSLFNKNVKNRGAHQLQLCYYPVER